MGADLPFVGTLAALIEFGGAMVVGVAVLRALAELVASHRIARAELLVIAGSLNGLGYKSAATLLKVIDLGSWRGIGMFAAIFTLRTLIKQVLVWERSHLVDRPDTTSATPGLRATHV